MNLNNGFLTVAADGSAALKLEGNSTTKKREQNMSQQDDCMKEMLLLTPTGCLVVVKQILNPVHLLKCNEYKVHTIHIPMAGESYSMSQVCI